MIKVAELKDERLDYWVARARGMKKGQTNYAGYSTVWAAGGPIIECEDISLVGCVDWSEKPPRIDQYSAVMFQKDPEVRAWGKTPLIAAMRCFVASKFGEEVDEGEIT